MIDVIGSQCFMIFVGDENLSEKGVLKFPERLAVFHRFQIKDTLVLISR